MHLRVYSDFGELRLEGELGAVLQLGAARQRGLALAQLLQRPILQRPVLQRPVRHGPDPLGARFSKHDDSGVLAWGFRAACRSCPIAAEVAAMAPQQFVLDLFRMQVLDMPPENAGGRHGKPGPNRHQRAGLANGTGWAWPGGDGAPHPAGLDMGTAVAGPRHRQRRSFVWPERAAASLESDHRMLHPALVSASSLEAWPQPGHRHKMRGKTVGIGGLAGEPKLMVEYHRGRGALRGRRSRPRPPACLRNGAGGGNPGAQARLNAGLRRLGPCDKAASPPL